MTYSAHPMTQDQGILDGLLFARQLAPRWLGEDWDIWDLRMSKGVCS